MTEFQIIVTFMSIGFTALGTMMLYLHSCMTKQMSEMRSDIKDIDRRLCRLEGAFASKDCCMIKHSHHSTEAV